MGRSFASAAKRRAILILGPFLSANSIGNLAYLHCGSEVRWRSGSKVSDRWS